MTTIKFSYECSKMNDIDIALEAAGQAVSVISYYRQNRDELNIRLKGRHDLLTEADLETEKKIVEVIKKYAPDDRILGEETHEKLSLNPQRTWIIDPIDGTTNFAHGFPIYCISIALWEDEQPKAAVIVEVNSGEVFRAEKGGGAYLNDKPIRVSNIGKPEQALLGTGFPYRDLELIDHYMKLFRVFMEETHGVRRPGSACYDLACVAAGRLDGFFEYALAPWDVGAGALIIREAGGIVTDWDGGDDWLFGKRIVCGNAEISNYILERIRETIPVNHRKSKTE